MQEVEEKLMNALCELDKETVKSITLYKWIENNLIAV
jgi:hypothetical protein